MPESSTILILGGPSAGKSVYLSVLYSHLWQGSGTMLMRAANGAMHGDLLKQAELLAAGTMPPATQALRHFDFELEHDRRLYYLSSLDYPGELFRKVFFDMVVDGDEVRELYAACEAAQGVILLVDPRFAVDASSETDFALSNFLRFLQSRRKVPKLVLAFTKRDENQQSVNGRLSGFVKKYLPRSAPLLGTGARLMHFSSIIRSKQGVQLANVEAVQAPLEYVIEEIERTQETRERDRHLQKLAFRRAAGAAGLVLAVLMGMLLAFVLGIFIRHWIATSR